MSFLRWLQPFTEDFRTRFRSLLGGYRTFYPLSASVAALSAVQKTLLLLWNERR